MVESQARMRLGHIELFVTDLERARRFYVDILGLELQDTPPGAGTWLRCGNTELLLRQGRQCASAPTYQAASAAIVLYTGDLQNTTQALRMRGVRFSGTDGTEKCLTFADPDGNWFQLVDPNDH
jgi:catechol 2,3-dioxygenase-like lactoylglutathione lyase family enzyme